MESNLPNFILMIYLIDVGRFDSNDRFNVYSTPRKIRPLCKKKRKPTNQPTIPVVSKGSIPQDLKPTGGPSKQLVAATRRLMMRRLGITMNNNKRGM